MKTARLPPAARNSRARRRFGLGLLLAGFWGGLISSHAAEPASPPPSTRERVSLNADWRFIPGDPAGNPTDLRYDVRPEVELRVDDGPADARPQEAVPGASADTVLKRWILPTANAFIRDPARHHRRPDGNPGGDVAYVRADFDDRGWAGVTLPHDWAIAGPFVTTGKRGGMGRLPSAGVGWYRKKLEIPASDAGKSLFLEVDGAMSYATVWLNGHLVGGWPFGYASWQLDLTPYALPGGENQLAIRLDNPPDSSRWYPGGGIYRNVRLTKTQPVHVGQWGTHVTTREVSAASATIDLQVAIANDAKAEATTAVTSRIFALDAAGRIAGEAVAHFPPVEVTVPAGVQATASASVALAHPALWGPPPTQTPHRYVAVTEVRSAGRLVDRYETRFGIRSLRFDPEKGLQVNG